MTLIFKDYYKKLINITGKKYFAGFDLDHTIIKPKSKNVFPKDLDDWTIMYPNIIVNKLKAINTNYIVVIFSNQKDMDSKFLQKIDNIQKFLDLEFIFIASTKKDIYRKPFIGMYLHLIEYFKTKYNITLEKEESFYVGDMAGRANDKMDSDYKFALNLNIPFYTPEEYFLGEPIQERTLSGYLLDCKNENKKLEIEIEIENSKACVAVIISGYPGSGKTYLAKKIEEKGYEHISKDIYGTKFNKVLMDRVVKGKPIVVEGLYPTNTVRDELKTILKKYNYMTHYIHMVTSYELSYHMNIFRSLTDDSKRVPDIVYMKYKKDFIPVDREMWDQYSEHNMDVPVEANLYYLF